MLVEKTWKWPASHGVGLLNLQLAGIGAEAQLRKLCVAVHRRPYPTATVVHSNKPLLADAYGCILGILADNLVWSYLNKDTHEERSEMTSIAT